jgi:hypothetical protein
MSGNITTTAVENDTVFIGDKVEELEVITGTVAGVAATITDTTSYAVTDQDGLTSIITIVGDANNTGAQTVTFSGATTTALQVAAQMNDQLTGCSAVVDTGQVVITTDKVGAGVTISAAAGTGAITWDTPTAGSGVSGSLVIAKGTLMARNTSTTKMVVYVASGSNGTGSPLGVIDTELTYVATGDLSAKVARGGLVDKGKLIVSATGAAPTLLVIDELMKDSSIVAVSVDER